HDDVEQRDEPHGECERGSRRRDRCAERERGESRWRYWDADECVHGERGSDDHFGGAELAWSGSDEPERRDQREQLRGWCAGVVLGYWHHCQLDEPKQQQQDHRE